jgi:hypothetical protein
MCVSNCVQSRNFTARRPRPHFTAATQKRIYNHTFLITDFCIAEFNTSDYEDDMGADTDAEDPPTCQYRGYRNPPQHEKKYDLSPQYWHVFAARLAFVVVFEVMSRACSTFNVHTIQIFIINSFSVSLTGLHIKT